MVEAHRDQWDLRGFFVFRADATFLGYPGRDLPLDQSNAMGPTGARIDARTGELQYRRHHLRGGRCVAAVSAGAKDQEAGLGVIMDRVA